MTKTSIIEAIAEQIKTANAHLDWALTTDNVCGYRQDVLNAVLDGSDKAHNFLWLFEFEN